MLVHLESERAGATNATATSCVDPMLWRICSAPKSQWCGTSNWEIAPGAGHAIQPPRIHRSPDAPARQWPDSNSPAPLITTRRRILQLLASQSRKRKNAQLLAPHRGRRPHCPPNFRDPPPPGRVLPLAQPPRPANRTTYGHHRVLRRADRAHHGREWRFRVAGRQNFRSTECRQARAC